MESQINIDVFGEPAKETKATRCFDLAILMQQIRNIKPAKETVETRSLAQRLIWRLSDEMKKLVRDPANCFLQADEMRHITGTVEWLSAIVCDDWQPSMFKQIHAEISKYPVLAFSMSSTEKGLWKLFCQEIAEQSGLSINYGPKKIKKNDQQLFEYWKALSLHETGFLHRKRQGFFSRFISVMTNNEPVYQINRHPEGMLSDKI